MRNRDHVWTAGDKRQFRLEEMDTPHLTNLLCWLLRRNEDIARTDVTLPAAHCNGSSYAVWYDRVKKELNRRRMEEVKQANRVLNGG